MNIGNLRAAKHEIRCAECRVTWRSWLQRLFAVKAGFTPYTEQETTK